MTYFSRSALAALLVNVFVGAAHAAPPASSPRATTGSAAAKTRAVPNLEATTLSPAAQVAAAAAAERAKNNARRKPESVKGASSLPTLSQIMAGRRVSVNAGPDTFLLRSSSFDVRAGGCDPRGWTAEDRAERVFAHVSERFKVNRDIFTWTPSLTPPLLPADIAGTPITVPQHVAANDSGMIFYVEGTTNDTTRIVAVYPGQNLMRTYAVLPGNDGFNAPFHIAHDKATGGLILGSNYGTLASPPLPSRGGRLYRIPAGGGTPVQIAGGGSTSLDAPSDDAVIEVPQEIVTDAAGNIYYSELGQPPGAWPRVRMLRSSSDSVITLAGMLFVFNDYGDGGPGTSAALKFPCGLAINATEDSLYILEGLFPNRVRVLSLATGIIDALPGAQYSDFLPDQGLRVSPYNLTYADGQLYVGCFGGTIVAWSGGSLTLVAGRGAFAEPEDAALGTAHSFGGNIQDLCPAPGGGVIFCAQEALLYRLNASDHVSVEAGVYGPMMMGERSLWFGADSTSAPDEVANWVNPHGFGSGWGQRLSSPPFSFTDHPNAKLSFDLRADIPAYGADELHEESGRGFFAVRGLRADGTWSQLQSTFVTDLAPSTTIGSGGRLTGTGTAHCEVDLSGASLADVTRLQILVQTERFGSNEDGFGTGSGAGALVLDNLRVVDSGDVLAPVDFEDGTTGAWTLSAVNAPYGSDLGDMFIRDFPPPATDVALRSGFDFSDPTCVWTFTSEGDSVPNGTYARITSPWIFLADPFAPAYLTFSGKLPTDNQKRYLKVIARIKNTGNARPRGILFSNNIYSSGTSGSDLASPFLNQVVLEYPFEFTTGTEGGVTQGDSIQFVLQIEDRLEEEAENFPQPRVPSRLPYLDDIRVYQLAGDSDGDGVANADDACPSVSSTGQDADSDGCPDLTSTLRHVETWKNESRPIHFRIVGNGDPTIADGSDLAAVRAAFAAWTGVAGATPPLVEDDTTSQTNAAAMDGINLVTWEDDLQFSPDILAITPTTSFVRRAPFDDEIVLPGQIVDSDLIFNSYARYRTSGTGPVPNSVDLQSVATHEIGHLLGLSHSGVEEATMFPVLLDGVEAASLEDDDRAAIRAAYPGTSYATDFGTITGTVLRGFNSQPIPGALVTAWLLDGTDAPLHGAASDYSDELGNFALRGLAPGSYGVRIDPLDGSVPGLVPEAINARVLSIAQTNFTPEWWTTGDDGVDPESLLTAIPVAAGATQSGRIIVTSVDRTPPEVVSVLPAEAATGVGIDGRVLVNFSEPIETATVGSAFALRKTGESGRLGGSAQLLNANRTFIFTPDDLLEFGTSYEVEIDTALTDRQGVHLAATQTSHFNTLPTPDMAIFDVQPRQAPPGAMITIRGHGFVSGMIFEWESAKGTVRSFGGIVSTPTTAVTRLDPGIDSGPIRLFTPGFADSTNPFNITVLRSDPGVPVPVGSALGLSFAPSDVALAPDGSSVFAVGAPGFASINLSPTRPLHRVEDFQALPGAHLIALARNGARAFVTRPDSSDLVVVDTDTSSAGFGHLFTRIPLPGPPGGVLVSPAGVLAFVSERLGSRVWKVDIDPTSGTYGGVLQEFDSTGVTLTGGIGLSVETESGVPNRSQRPRAHLETFDHVYLTSSSNGTVRLNPRNGTFEDTDPRPCSDNLVMTSDGYLAIAIGSGTAEGQITRACVSGGCVVPNPVANLGGRPRDLVVDVSSGALLVVNSTFGELQVLEPFGSGYRLIGQVATGRSPVAIATSADGRLSAVANAGDHTVSVFSIGAASDLELVIPDVAMPGDAVMARLTSGTASDFAPDLNVGPIVRAHAAQNALTFRVPEVSQRATSVALQSGDRRTQSLPFRIVDRVESFTPSYTGVGMPVPSRGCSFQSGVQTMAVSPDGSVLAAIQWNSECGARVHAFQLRDGAPEPLFENLPGYADFPDNQRPTGCAFTSGGTHLWSVAGGSGSNGLNDHLVAPTFGGTSTVVFVAGFSYAVVRDPLLPQMWASQNLDVGGQGVYRYSETHVQTGPIALADQVLALAASPDGRVIVAGGVGRVFFIDPSSSSQHAWSPSLQHLAAGNAVHIAVTSDARRAVATFQDGSIGVWSLEPGSEGSELFFGSLPAIGATVLGNLIPSPDGTGVLGGAANVLTLFKIDASTDPPTVTSAALPSPAPVIARSPDGRHLYACAASPTTVDTIRVYTLSEGTALSLVSGGGQEALAGTPLPLPVRVHVRDAFGNAQAGALVEFSVADNTQGSIGDSVAVAHHADVNGEAQIAWTMPATTGVVTMSVRAPGLPIAPLIVTARSSESDATAAPVIVAFGPPEGATGIAAGTDVFVRFSQAMDEYGITQAVRLRVGTDVVGGSYRFEEGGHAVFFNPDSPLPYQASCTLEVDSLVTDVEGQSLAVGAVAHFTVQAEPTLAITVVAPPAGPPGTAVTLNGAGFSPVTGLNTVTFNGVLAPVISASPTTLIARVPATATSGNVQVQVASLTSNGSPFLVLPADPTPGTIVDTLPAPPNPVHLAITPDGRRAYVVSPSTNSVGALDIFAAREIAVIPVGSNPRGIAILPDGSRAYVANRDGADVSIIGTDPLSANYNRVLGTIKVGPRPVAIAVVSGGPKVIVICPGDSSAKLIDAERGNATFDQVVKNIPIPAGGGNITVCPDGTRVFVATGEGVSIIDLASFVVKNIPIPAGGGSVTITPDGGLLFVITNDNRLVVLDVSPTSSTPNRVIKNIPLPAGGGTVTVSPDGSMLFVTLVDDGSLLIFRIERSTSSGDGASSSPGDPITLEVLSTPRTGTEPFGAAADPFGEFVLVANQASNDITVVLTTDAPPEVQVVYPNGGEVLMTGDTEVVRWSTTRFTAGQFVDLYLSRDNGATWEPIATDLANDGEYAWEVGAPTSGLPSPAHTGLLEVRARNPFGATDTDRSDQPFAIFDLVTPTLLVAFSAEPRAGGMEIRWQFSDASEVGEITVERAEAAEGPWTVVEGALRTEGEALVALDRTTRQGRSYFYRLASRSAGGTRHFGPIAATMPVTEFALDAVGPNPSRGSVGITFAVAREGLVQVSVIDVSGRRVATLADGVRAPGLHRVVWDGASSRGRAAAGLYFVRYEGGGKAFSRRIVLAP